MSGASFGKGERTSLHYNRVMPRGHGPIPDSGFSGIDLRTRQGEERADARLPARAAARNREDRRLLAAQEAPQEISGEHLGSAATAVSRPEESRLPVVQF